MSMYRGEPACRDALLPPNPRCFEIRSITMTTCTPWRRFFWNDFRTSQGDVPCWFSVRIHTEYMVNILPQIRGERSERVYLGPFSLTLPCVMLCIGAVITNLLRTHVLCRYSFPLTRDGPTTPSSERFYFRRCHTICREAMGRWHRAGCFCYLLQHSKG